MSNGKQTLRAAICEGELEIVKNLVEEGAQVNYEEFRLTLADNRLNILDYFLEKKCLENLTKREMSFLFFISTAEGHLEMAKKLRPFLDFHVDYVDHSAKEDHYRRSILAAIEGEHFDMVQWLREEGASLEMLEGEEESPIHASITGRNGERMMEIFKYLMGETTADKKVGPNVRDKYGNSLLIKASNVGGLECVEFLCGCREVALNAVNKYGKMPIQVAAENVFRINDNWVSIVNILHEKMIKEGLKVNVGELAFHVCYRRRDNCPVPE